MKHLLSFALLALCLSVVRAELAPLYRAADGARVEGEYIVQFKGDIANLASAVQTLKTVLLNDPNTVVKSVYEIGSSFRGLHLKTTPQMIEELRSHSAVAHVEEDQVVSISNACHSQSGSIWNLDRINKKEISQVDGTYKWDQDASEIDVYIVDTGIQTSHTEFGGRAIWGANYADSTNADCNGHGTHVAGTVGGETVGVAKKVTLIAVKVLACSGSGTVSGVISGVQYTADSAQRRGRRGVANMSLGGGYSAALNDAVAGAVKAGVAFAVAAGNENQDACNVSPASESSAITVGATFYSGNLAKDTRATFSNHGTCVDVFAPGQNIKSAWIGSDNAYNTISGTSMASPHAAGLAALILASNPNYTTDQIKGALLENSTPDQIDLQCTCWFCNCNKSPNKMLFTASC